MIRGRGGLSLSVGAGEDSRVDFSIFSSNGFRSMPYCHFQPVRSFGLLSVLIVVAWSADARGQMQFDNGNPIYGVYPPDVLSDDAAPLHIADDFVLSAGKTTISRIMWFGYDTTVSASGPIPAREYHVEIYKGDPAMLAPSPVPIHSFRFVTPTRTFVMSGGAPVINFGDPILRCDLQISPITLDPGCQYWISIYAAVGSAPLTWYWAHRSTSGNIAFRVPTYAPFPYFMPLSFYSPLYFRHGGSRPDGWGFAA